MQISNVHIREVLGAYLNKVEPRKSIEAASASSEMPSDAVELSPEARLVALAHQMMANLPDIRTEKVEAIRQRMDSGQYQVDSQKVADKIIETMRAEQE
jgi:negative regulator of flagellin synthesis FlgM